MKTTPPHRMVSPSSGQSSSSTPSRFGMAKMGMLAICGLALLASCEQTSDEVIRQQVVSQTTLTNVRLADGIPLRIDVSTRWEIQNKDRFEDQFQSRTNYDSLVLFPRQLELANNVSNQYQNVDSVFTTQKHKFITDLKQYITENLGEEGIQINEVIIANIKFPPTYTKAKEKLAMQDQELKRIRKQSSIDLENAEAKKEQTSAQGEVSMAAAIMDAKVQKINAETEKSRRRSELARAETQKQVAEKQAEADARRQVLLAKADLERQTDLKNLDIQKQRDLNKVSLEQKNDMEILQFSQDMKMAKLCNDNPVYATYMVNKELASKVKIAVLPSGQNASVFQGFLENGMATK